MNNHLMEYFKVSDSINMPAIGCGTNTFGRECGSFRSPVNGDFSPVLKALKAGYRMFDTAIAYGNEDGIGTALSESKISREELFLVGKLKSAPEYTKNEDAVIKGFKGSLAALKTDYMDVYLIHKPLDDADQMAMVWRTLLSLKSDGLIREVGVSNFTADQIKLLGDMTGVCPLIDQISYNSQQWNLDLVKELNALSVTVMAYAPLTLSVEMKDFLTRIAEKYGRSFSQIILRHNYQKGIVSIPKSHSYQHLAENISIFDFELEDRDIGQIDEAIKRE